MVKKVVNISIPGSKSKELTNKFNEDQENKLKDSINEISGLDFIPENYCEQAPKIDPRNDDSLWDIINCMNGHPDE